jgi:glycerate kinase
MNILLSPDSYKGNLTARQVCDAMAEGVSLAAPEATVDLVPMADGGDGTVDAVLAAIEAEAVQALVHGPLGELVEAKLAYVAQSHTAVIEMASASGLTLLSPDSLDPLSASTFGTGELILKALDLGCRRLVIGIGGSATNDAGTGMARALGVRFLDSRGCELPPGGAALSGLASIDLSGLDPRLSSCNVDVACDVNNPLYGPSGAAAVYGPQKGATDEMILVLDAAMMQFSRVLKEQHGIDVADVPGAGAAGGLGAGLLAFLGARLGSGVNMIADLVRLPERIRGADLVITGEGRLDAQSSMGKAVQGVARLCHLANVPVVALVGALDPAAFCTGGMPGLTAAFSVLPGPASLDRALEEAAGNITFTTSQVVRLYQAARFV